MLIIILTHNIGYLCNTSGQLFSNNNSVKNTDLRGLSLWILELESSIVILYQVSINIKQSHINQFNTIILNYQKKLKQHVVARDSLDDPCKPYTKQQESSLECVQPNSL